MTPTPPPGYKPKLIEKLIPLRVINTASAREKYIRQGHPSTLHLWWARRPLAAARAILWASLVDDPSAHPNQFPTVQDQLSERQRLFGILEKLVQWKNSNNKAVLEEAHTEIKKSCGDKLPNILDPFCGGGTIPLEANRLGLPVFGGDLNPIPVLITKAMVEIPIRFAGMPPVNPGTPIETELKTWGGAQGLAEDIIFYGKWLRDHAQDKIGHLYPSIELPSSYGGGLGTVMAWFWARTVPSPDYSWNGYVPLIQSGILRKKDGKNLIWIQPITNQDHHTVSYQIKTGGTPTKGTMRNRGKAICVATDSTISNEYIKQMAQEGQLEADCIGLAVESKGGKIYLPCKNGITDPGRPTVFPTGKLSKNSRYMVAPLYGMETTDSLFTNRQLTAMLAFSNSLKEIRPIIERHALESGLPDTVTRLRDGGDGYTAYADAVITYLAFAIDRCADYWSSLCIWQNGRESIGHTFGRQAIPMVWDYVEANPFSSSSGNWLGQVQWIAKAVANITGFSIGDVTQRNAADRIGEIELPVISTDPPYYDNVPYADISDFFYVWMKHNISEIWPDEFATILTPKREELVADPIRAGSKARAKNHFEKGMKKVMIEIAKHQNPLFPATIFYAFKATQTNQENKASSTGWSTFLQGLIDAGLQVTATWPIRTEISGGLKAKKAMLASSVVLACRTRMGTNVETRGGLIEALKRELPDAIRMFKNENISPVDMAQSAIGPGMSIFSRYTSVKEADGSPMRVHTALGLINEVLSEVLYAEEAELDDDSRFALTWFEQFGYTSGNSDEADKLARAKNTDISSVVKSGILESLGNKVRLFRREELSDWLPAEKRRTDWEIVQHLIRLLRRSEMEADVVDRARQLAYLLYAVCEEKKWSEEAVAYNSLITTWPELSRLASTAAAGQQNIL